METREIVGDIFDRLLSDNEEENESAKKDIEEIIKGLSEFKEQIEWEKEND